MSLNSQSNKSSPSNNISHFTDLSKIEQSLEVSDYLLGRLSKKQKVQFEARLASDQDLQRLLAEEKSFSDGIKQSAQNYTVSENNFASFSQTIASLATEDKPTISATDTIEGLEKSSFISIHKKFIGIAASIMAIVSITFITTHLIQNNPSFNNQTDFRTLSNDTNLISNNDGTIYQVIFSPQLNQQNITEITRKYGFELLDNSGANNGYLIRVKQPLSNVEQGLLRDTDDILFIEQAVLEN